jgi:hypothetical protein
MVNDEVEVEDHLLIDDELQDTIQQEEYVVAQIEEDNGENEQGEMICDIDFGDSLNEDQKRSLELHRVI